MQELFEQGQAYGNSIVNVSWHYCWCSFCDYGELAGVHLEAVWVKPASYKTVFPLQTSSLLFRPHSVSIWAVAKAFGFPPHTHFWNPEHCGPQGSSLGVSGDEVPTHTARVVPTHTAPSHATPLPFAIFFPFRKSFSPMLLTHSIVPREKQQGPGVARPTDRLPGLQQAGGFVKPQA